MVRHTVENVKADRFFSGSVRARVKDRGACGLDAGWTQEQTKTYGV